MTSPKLAPVGVFHSVDKAQVEALYQELRPFAEKLITTGKLGTVASQRSLVAKIGVIGSKTITKDLSPKYKERKGGYTRITKLPARLSDGSLMAVIEFV